MTEKKEMTFPEGEAKIVRKRFFSLRLQNDRKEGTDLPQRGKVSRRSRDGRGTNIK